VMAATALLALAYTLARELIGTTSPQSRREPRAPKQKQRTRHEPPKPASAPEPTPVKAPAPTMRPAAAAKPAAVQPATPKPAAEIPAARKLPVVRPAMTGPAAAPPPAEAKAGPAPKPEQQDRTDTTTKPSVWRAQKPAKRPSWLQVNEPRRVRPAPEPEAPRQEPTQASRDASVKAGRGAAMESERVKTAEAPPAAGTPSSETQSGPQPAATGLLDRLRQEFTEDVEEAGIREKSNAPKRLGGLLDRFRRTANEQAAKWKPRASSSKPKGGHMAALSPNDLRHYLTQRIAASEVDEPAERSSKPKSRALPAGPVLKSLDTVLDKVLDAATGGLPRALLVAGTSSGADATKAAIGLARALADRNEQVVLVDLAKGASAVSGPLGMPRVPGFADLSAGRANFGDVIRVDDETPLQVIAAGNPAVHGEGPEPDRFMRVFEALTQAYGCVVLHADLAAIEVLMPALKFELPIMVAVLPPRGNVESEDEALATFQALGCPIMVYEGSGRLRRSGLFSRSAAV
jgi:hypothetical protein